MAMVAVGPRPGSTPISVPSSVPMKQYMILAGCSAVPRPMPRLLMRSILIPQSDGLHPWAEKPDRRTEPPGEHRDAENGETDREREGQQRPDAHACERGDEGDEGQRGDEAEALQRQAEDDGTEQDEEHAAPGNMAPG